MLSHTFLKYQDTFFPLSLQIVMLDSISFIVLEFTAQLKKILLCPCTKIASCTAYVLVIKRSVVCFPENTQEM